MKVQIRDRRALSSLSLSSLRVYLRSHGWADDGPWGDRATIFTREHDARGWEVLVPLRDTVADYAENMAAAVAILATVEDRSQLDVFSDLKGAGADEIRLRSSNGAADGPLSLPRSAGLLGHAYDMLAFAARSVERPQATYRGRPSAEVAEYLDVVQPLLHYDEGYKLTLHSPVPPKFGIRGDLEGDLQEPFSRRVTRRLAGALTQASTAIGQAEASRRLDAFEQAVSFGVSANLCDSVAALARQSHGIAVDLFWADVRPSGIPPLHVRFSENSVDVLSEAAQSFRDGGPFLDECVTVQVVKLERKAGSSAGEAVVLDIGRDGRPRHLRAEFEPSAYDTVVKAFTERKPISMEGDIYRKGNTYELRRPRNLSFITEGLE